jgi:hypothetical protein
VEHDRRAAQAVSARTAGSSNGSRRATLTSMTCTPEKVHSPSR